MNTSRGDAAQHPARKPELQTPERQTTEPPTSEVGSERNARIAVTVFPLLIIAAAVYGYLDPTTAKQLTPHVNTLLTIIMFAMGLTLTLPDFALVARRPVAVLVGVLGHYLIMPLVGFAIAHLLRLSPDLAAGVILVGCAPSGTASNVINFLARSDTALSVTLASVSTLLAPLLTPILTLWLAGTYMPVDGWKMAGDIVKIVLVPVFLGLAVRLVLRDLVNRVLPLLPWLSVVSISLVVAGVVGPSAQRLASAGAVVFAAVVLHNACGYLLGYWFSRLLRQDARSSRTISVEVGMQNSGLAAGLASSYFHPAAALPAAVFSVWHNISGALLAMWFRRHPVHAGR